MRWLKNIRTLYVVNKLLVRFDGGQKKLALKRFIERVLVKPSWWAIYKIFTSIRNNNLLLDQLKIDLKSSNECLRFTIWFCIDALTVVNDNNRCHGFPRIIMVFLYQVKWSTQKASSTATVSLFLAVHFPSSDCQKQPPRGVSRKWCSAISKQLSRNQTSAWVFSCKLVAFFQNILS